MKNSVIRVILITLLVFLAINIAWFSWSRIKFGSYTDGMEKADMGDPIVLRYTYTDAEHNDYLVKYPNYLSLEGNIYVGLPATDENPFNDGLIAWPKLYGDYDFGVVLHDEDGTEYLVEIDSEGNALSSEYNDVVSRHSDNIRALLTLADERWDILK